MSTEYEQMLLTKYDLMFESRLSKVETGLENAEKNLGEAIKSLNFDIRWMFGIFMAFDTAILALMAKGFHWFV